MGKRLFLKFMSTVNLILCVVLFIFSLLFEKRTIIPYLLAVLGWLSATLSEVRIEKLLNLNKSIKHEKTETGS